MGTKRQDTFRYAIAGVLYVFKTQRNMRVHCSVAFCVLILGFIVGLEAMEFAILLLTIALVVVTEAVNTAIEKTVDLITAEYHPLAKVAKNVAAGAVFMATVSSVFVGVLLFSPATINTINDHTIFVTDNPLRVALASGSILLLVVLWGYRYNKYSGLSIGGGTAIFSLLFLIRPSTLLSVFVASVIVILASMHVYVKNRSSNDVLFQVSAGVLLAITLWPIWLQL